ncbi:MAG TPA: hypothetical protein VLJ17_09690 [Xanthobacteraceae bacterium]|nr:hypothetical protein [Xanthobacteraceae bacterium]
MRSPNGTLVLPGIAGAAALGAKVHTESQNSAAQTAAAAVARKEADKATIEAAQRAAAPLAVAAEIDVAEKAKTEAIKIAEAASARANAVYNPPDSQTPQWSDLLINETRLVDGT